VLHYMYIICLLGIWCFGSVWWNRVINITSFSQ